MFCTVGMLDPQTDGAEQRLRETVRKQVPERIFQKAQCFYLLGRLDYSTMSRKHRLMMAGLCAVLKRKSQPTEDDRMIIDSLGKQLDQMDLRQLEPLVEALS